MHYSEYVFYVPIPEKQQLQHNYILFPRSTALSATKSFPPVDFEPLLFTVPPTAPKPGVVGGYAAATAAQVSDSYTSLMHWAITSQLLAVGNTNATITAPDPRIFHSTAKQAYRPNERAVHVKAHRGTKDGFLFFLPNGILWGYKKPLLFIPLDRIVAVSYTNVLQRTFDITIEVDVSHAPHQQQGQEQDGEGGEGGGVKTEEIEFSMIDHEDYGVIDDSYIQRHGLNNRSMAEGRRAKRQLREGGAKQAANANGGAPIDPEEAALVAALDKAEEMLEQDEEDEEEEDYDPGSEGESEGEGSSSEEESDEDGDGDDDDGEDEEDEDGLEDGEGDEMEVEGGRDGHE